MLKCQGIVGILTFMSMINFVLSWVEHGKSLIASGLGLDRPYLDPNFSKLWWYYSYRINLEKISRQQKNQENKTQHAELTLIPTIFLSWKCHLLNTSAAYVQIHSRLQAQFYHWSKQEGPWSDCSYRSSLIWVNIVCIYTQSTKKQQQMTMGPFKQKMSA